MFSSWWRNELDKAREALGKVDEDVAVLLLVLAFIPLLLVLIVVGVGLFVSLCVEVNLMEVKRYVAKVRSGVGCPDGHLLTGHVAGSSV